VRKTCRTIGIGVLSRLLSRQTMLPTAQLKHRQCVEATGWDLCDPN
jgi:hypothetical protein